MVLTAPEAAEFYSDGELLRGRLFRPDCIAMTASSERAARVPGVVFCPGFAASSFRPHYELYIESLRSIGYTVLLIDYRGWGDSKGVRGRIDPRDQIADVRAALTFLGAQKDIGSLGLLGTSLGGSIAICAAAREPRVRAVGVLNAIGDCHAWLRGMRREYEWQLFRDELERERRNAVLTGELRLVQVIGDLLIPAPERKSQRITDGLPAGSEPREVPLMAGAALLEFRAVEDVARLGGRCALLLMHAKDDVVVPEDQANWLYSAARAPKRRRRLLGGHYGAYFDEAITTELQNWFMRYLPKADAPAVNTTGTDEQKPWVRTDEVEEALLPAAYEAVGSGAVR